MASSKGDLLDCLIHGFVRHNYIKRSNKIYPLSLNEVIFQFLGNILCLFNVVRQDFNMAINDDPSIVRSIGSICIVGNSHGFSSGINEFRIKVIKGGEDVIGIVSNIHECIKHMNQWIYYNEQKSVSHFTWYRGSQTIFEYMNGRMVKQRELDLHDRWRKDDIVKIVVDCTSHKVAFYKNDELIHGDIPIKPNTTYHLMMCLNVSSSRYQILSWRRLLM